MSQYEKRALIKFIAVYFTSTAFFILILGYLYFLQQQTQILQRYTMQMQEYTLRLKQTRFTHTQEGYRYVIKEQGAPKYRFATKEGAVYKKSFPIFKGRELIEISLDADIIDQTIGVVKWTIIKWQVGLLLFFFLLSIYLAKISLKPMQEAITYLDRFTKDLIHDLNTPATSILLNAKTLHKEISGERGTKKLNRIEQSAQMIASLYENLEVVLERGQLSKEEIDLKPLIDGVVADLSLEFPHLTFLVEEKEMRVLTHPKAIIRIINNILSNAVKYSKKEGRIRISFDDTTLCIEDDGKGMKYPDKIFDRNYTEQQGGHGIGMHIVQRLCSELDIGITIDSQENIGTTICLNF